MAKGAIDQAAKQDIRMALDEAGCGKMWFHHYENNIMSAVEVYDELQRRAKNLQSVNPLNSPMERKFIDIIQSWC